MPCCRPSAGASLVPGRVAHRGNKPCARPGYVSSAGGFSLIEVIIAVTMIALVAASGLGLAGYHKSAAARVEKRFILYNTAAALLADVPFIIREHDEKFPFLEKNEDFLNFEGMYKGYQWQAQLTRMSVTGLDGFYKINLTLSNDKDSAEFIRYMAAGREPGKEQR